MSPTGSSGVVYMVQTTINNFDKVAAFKPHFVDGDLVFTDEDGLLFVAYARGQWISVHTDEEDY